MSESRATASDLDGSTATRSAVPEYGTAVHTASTEPMASQPPADINIADPAPLGLAAFAMTTFMLSVFNTNMLPTSLASGVLGLALFYGGGMQVLAGMWEFRKGNTFGALAYCSFGAFWLSFWYYDTRIVPGLPAAEVHKVSGLFLLGWTIFSFYMTIAALRTTGIVAAIFVALTVTLVLLTVGAFATGSMALDWSRAGGWAGLVTAAMAWYASFAAIANTMFARTLMPTWPISPPAQQPLAR